MVGSFKLALGCFGIMISDGLMVILGLQWSSSGVSSLSFGYASD